MTETAQSTRSGNPEPTTNVGTEVLFENEVLRVWRMFLPPGACSELHVHLYDHVLVYANPSVMEARVLGEDKPIQQPSDEGFVYYREVGDSGLTPHRLANVGNSDSTHYIIELLGESRSRTAKSPEHNNRLITGPVTDWERAS
jgi:hypothetical protein